MKHKISILAIVISVAAMGISATTPQADAKIKRSYSARSTFAYAFPCPSTGKRTVSCKGYVIDHIISLDCGGEDDASNMQWQTTEDAHAKDKYERNGPSCKHRTHGVMPK
jgi:hypothetical protein